MQVIKVAFFVQTLESQEDAGTTGNHPPGAGNDAAPCSLVYRRRFEDLVCFMGPYAETYDGHGFACFYWVESGSIGKHALRLLIKLGSCPARFSNQRMFFFRNNQRMKENKIQGVQMSRCICMCGKKKDCVQQKSCIYIKLFLVSFSVTEQPMERATYAAEDEGDAFVDHVKEGGSNQRVKMVEHDASRLHGYVLI